MSINVIKVMDGSNTLSVFCPATFVSVHWYVTTGTPIGEDFNVVITLNAQVINLRFSSQSTASAAMAQLFTDLQSYYNQ